jgi:hypothetical protein
MFKPVFYQSKVDNKEIIEIELKDRGSATKPLITGTVNKKIEMKEQAPPSDESTFKP